MESRRRILALGFSSSSTTTVMGMVAVLLLSLISTTSHGVSAQAPSPSIMSPSPSIMAGGPSPMVESQDCFTSILNMSDCLTYVEAGSNLTTPEKGCCPSLAGLVESNPICLCQLLGNSSTFGIQLDLKRAIGLPKVCRVDTPSTSLCAEIGLPIGVPTASEGPTSPATLSPGGAPVGSIGPESMPPSLEGNNGSSSTRNSFTVFLVGISSFIVAMVF